MRRFFVLTSGFLSIMLFTFSMPSVARADSSMPILAYVAGTDSGISVIDVSQRKVITKINTLSNPSTVLLSTDARFLYVAEPDQNRVVVIGAKQGNIICTTDVPGKPTFLALDISVKNNTLFAAGDGASTVSAINPTNCNIKHIYQVDGLVNGLAVAQASSGVNGRSESQLWVADTTSLTYFDDVKPQKLGNFVVPGGPHYLSVPLDGIASDNLGYIDNPPNETIYVTTYNGSVIAVDRNTHHIVTMVTGSSYGPINYDEATGEIYVLDTTKDEILALSPVNLGLPISHQPNHTVSLHGVQPQSIATTNDGQLGFAALAGGNVAMIDIPKGQILQTIHVGGNPRSIIIGLYPPTFGTTPQQASTFTTILSVTAYLFVVTSFVIPILLLRKYTRKRKP